MDIGILEANTIILKKTTKYLNGKVKEIVERQIRSNYKTIDSFFDDSFFNRFSAILSRIE